MNKEIFKKINYKKLVLIVIVIIALTTVFMSALTFNFVGNSIYSFELILGFVTATLTFIATIFLGFHINKNSITKINLLLLVVIILLAIVAIVFGTIGYIGKS